MFPTQFLGLLENRGVFLESIAGVHQQISSEVSSAINLEVLLQGPLDFGKKKILAIPWEGCKNL